MLPLVPLCLLFGWMLPADSYSVVLHRFPIRGSDQVIPLSMAEDSVDDMYDGCLQEMMGEVKLGYSLRERQSREFRHAWSTALRCAWKKPDKEDEALTFNHMRAICMYTGDYMYKTFNDAVRTQGRVYGSTFKFHSLHYFLTSAIQILNSKKHCYTTYRRTSLTFIGRVNQRIRFGSFASSSKKTDLFIFGWRTCFKIKTCLGAYLKKYSFYGNYEEEVLIPPYETFRVTKKTEGLGKPKGLEDCLVVYELESVGATSRLNCKAVNTRASSADSSRLEDL